MKVYNFKIEYINFVGKTYHFTNFYCTSFEEQIQYVIL